MCDSDSEWWCYPEDASQACVCVHQRHIDSNAVWHENPAGFTAVTTQTSHLSLKCLIANLDWVFDTFSIIHPHLYGKHTTRDRLQLIFIPMHSSKFLGGLRFTVTYSALTYWSPQYWPPRDTGRVWETCKGSFTGGGGRFISQVTVLSASWVWFASHLDSLCFDLGSSSSTSFFTVNNTFTGWLAFGIKMSWIRLGKKQKQSNSIRWGVKAGNFHSCYNVTCCHQRTACM